MPSVPQTAGSIPLTTRTIEQDNLSYLEKPELRRSQVINSELFSMPPNSARAQDLPYKDIQ